jgi:hypothetical protein
VGSERDAVMKRCSCGYLPLPDATRCPKCGAVVVRESAGFHDGPSAAQDHDWRTDIVMPDDETQTLADVLDVMRSNHLQRQAAFVEWLAGDWYDARAELQSRDMGETL